jgi:RNA polymerase sigma factor (sigma-70 family)
MQQFAQQHILPASTQFEELYRMHAHTLLRFVRRQVQSMEEAEDIVLDVFIAAMESKTILKLGQHEQQAWLHRVALNKCMDVHRRATRKPTVSLDILAENILHDNDWEPDSIVARQEEYALLHETLSGLTEQQREILRLKFSAGLHSPEIARRMNKSDSAIRMMLARTLNLLRTIYTGNGERRED